MFDRGNWDIIKMSSYLDDYRYLIYTDCVFRTYEQILKKIYAKYT